MNKSLIKAIAFIAGFFFLLEYLWTPAFALMVGVKNPVSAYMTDVTNALMVLAAMAFFLGPINLTRSEIMQIVKRRKGWGGSIVFLVMLVLGFIGAAWTYPAVDMPEPEMQVVFRQVSTHLFNAIFYGINMAFYITSMGLITFYLVSAAHRAFMLNNVESGIMMLSATIVILGLTPLGDYMSQFMPKNYGIASIGNWIREIPNTAVQKAVVFGACGGAFTAAVRNWLSLGKGVSQ